MPFAVDGGGAAVLLFEKLGKIIVVGNAACARNLANWERRGEEQVSGMIHSAFFDVCSGSRIEMLFKNGVDFVM
jgi:hypothetical protein